MTLTKKGFDQKKITGCILALLRDEGNDETALRKRSRRETWHRRHVKYDI
jgi:hypothetical protein